MLLLLDVLTELLLQADDLLGIGKAVGGEEEERGERGGEGEVSGEKVL